MFGESLDEGAVVMIDLCGAATRVRCAGCGSVELQRRGTSTRDLFGRVLSGIANPLQQVDESLQALTYRLHIPIFVSDSLPTRSETVSELGVLVS